MTVAFWSNCYIEARIEYWVRKRRWRRDPSQPMPYRVSRPSHASRWISHHFVGTYDESLDAVRISSFKPERPRKKLSLWQLPVAILFRGRWVRGEFPMTIPFDKDDGKPISY